MRKGLLAIIILFNFYSANAQVKKESFFVYKEDWSPANGMDDAFYFMQMQKENDTVYTCKYYHVTGPMIRWETYRDANFDTPHGRFVWYNEQGGVDSTGTVWNGRKDGYWNYNYTDSFRAMTTVQYDRGKFIRRTDHNRQKKLSAEEARHLDSIIKAEDPTQKEAQFRGGGAAWRKYLERNLKTPDRYGNIVPRGLSQGMVIVAFLVDPDGKVSDAYLEKSVEWSVDNEALRLIKYSPSWSPAIQKGQPVYYRQKQSITFQVQKE